MACECVEGDARKAGNKNEMMAGESGEDDGRMTATGTGAGRWRNKAQMIREDKKGIRSQTRTRPAQGC